MHLFKGYFFADFQPAWYYCNISSM